MEKDFDEEIISIVEKKDGHLIKNVKIIKNNNQYSLKIPKEFVDDLDIDRKVDKFQFEIITNEDNTKILIGRIIKNGI